MALPERDSESPGHRAANLPSLSLSDSETRADSGWDDLASDLNDSSSSLTVTVTVTAVLNLSLSELGDSGCSLGIVLRYLSPAAAPQILVTVSGQPQAEVRVRDTAAPPPALWQWSHWRTTGPGAIQ